MPGIILFCRKIFVFIFIDESLFLLIVRKHVQPERNDTRRCP